MISAAFAACCLAFALAQIALGLRAELWDDALFFQRIAYNILHHGVAAWNPQDGPVFMSTSQTHQLVSTVLLALAPRYFNAMIVLWSAACLWATFVLLRKLLRQIGHPSDTLDYALFVALQAPPLSLAVGSGMDTCTVVLVIALAMYVLLSPRFRGHAIAAALACVAVYVSRPDAVLLPFGVALGVFFGLPARRWPRMGTFLLYTAAGIAIVSLVFHFYYGTAFPLATRLKVSPISPYDHDYIALGFFNKRLNLYMTALVAVPLLALSALRRDGVNITLIGSALVFIGFHAAATNEIMGYHARFYAPALPLLMVAALRGLDPEMSARRRVVLVGAGAIALAAVLIAFYRGWIESSSHRDLLEQVPLRCYLPYFGGIVLLTVFLSFPESMRRPTTVVVATASAAAVALLLLPSQPRIAADVEIHKYTAATDRALLGLDMIGRCFHEPLQFTHSELGIPGVLFPESRIIDYTGLANPSIVNGTFDFDAMCEHDRPEFLFRPHVTHKRLNEIISASRCLASQYVAVTSIRESSCPLYVRRDLADRFATCRASHPDAR